MFIIFKNFKLSFFIQNLRKKLGGVADFLKIFLTKVWNKLKLKKKEKFKDSRE